MTGFNLAGYERDGFFVRERHDHPHHACVLHLIGGRTVYDFGNRAQRPDLPLRGFR
jgi:hypothetical protein